MDAHLTIHSEGLPWFQARSSHEGLGLAGQENKVRVLLGIQFNHFQRCQILAGNRFPNRLRISFCHQSLSMRVLTTL